MHFFPMHLYYNEEAVLKTVTLLLIGVRCGWIMQTVSIFKEDIGVLIISKLLHLDLISDLHGGEKKEKNMAQRNLEFLI